MQGSIYWKIHPPRGEGKYQPMPFGGKNTKSGREKERTCKQKRKKGEKGRTRKEKDKRGSKRVKQMQNTE